MTKLGVEQSSSFLRTFAIPCSVFDIPSLSPDVLAAKRENPLLRPRVGASLGTPPPVAGRLSARGVAHSVKHLSFGCDYPCLI